MKVRITTTSAHFILTSIIPCAAIYLGYPAVKAVLEIQYFPLSAMAVSALVVIGAMPFVMAQLTWSASGQNKK